ncbi:MAG TPA: YraN family protein [Stellaceae bacterium]|nr:YraN family protein [Stellaceae bacterium]
MSVTSRRRRAERRGRWAERLSLWTLRLKGYRILARDYRVRTGEIDILARRGSVIAAVEVKARESEALALEAVTPHQRRRIGRAAAHFLSGRPELGHLSLRFDVMLVLPGRFPRHLRDAWREEG